MAQPDPVQRSKQGQPAPGVPGRPNHPGSPVAAGTPATKPGGASAHAGNAGAGGPDTAGVNEGPSMNDQFVEWVRTEGAWWASSFVFHMLLACVLMLFSTRDDRQQLGEAPSFGEATQDQPVEQTKLDPFDPKDAPLDPTELTTESLTLTQPPGGPKQEAIDNGPEAEFTPRGGGIETTATTPQLGGLGGFTVFAPGPGVAATGLGGVGVGKGEGRNAGAGGSGSGFGGRGTGRRKGMLGGFGGTKLTERAVAAALNWLSRHQSPDGSWSISDYVKQCKDPTCTGPGTFVPSESGATALGLLPFLAAGQTHEKNGPYKMNIYRGLYWLMQHQKPDGDLAAGVGQPMYSHGLASIALCEAYGMTDGKDKMLGRAAQQAIKFIESAQNQRTGGWRYTPGEEGDTSVVGWQVMALKSAQMAGIPVNQATFDGAKQFLKSCSSGS